MHVTQDSFKSCTTFTAAVHVLQILVPDLLSRLQEDFEVRHSTLPFDHLVNSYLQATQKACTEQVL